MQPGNAAPNSLGEIKWSVCDCGLVQAGHRGFVALAFPAHPPPQSLSDWRAHCSYILCLSHVFHSSPLPPIHGHSLQEEGNMSALTALEDKFNRNGWRRPKKVMFYYSCCEKGYQGSMEPHSCWCILWLRSFGVYWTWKGIRRDVEREVNLNCNWCAACLRMVWG